LKKPFSIANQVLKFHSTLLNDDKQEDDVIAGFSETQGHLSPGILLRNEAKQAGGCQRALQPPADVMHKLVLVQGHVGLNKYKKKLVWRTKINCAGSRSHQFSSSPSLTSPDNLSNFVQTHIILPTLLAAK
jgi:hypothetical protein